MKILCFSDLHCDAEAAKNLVRKARECQADLCIGAGDFANQHRGIELTIRELRETSVPCFLVPGNGETTEELQAAISDWPNAEVLHGNGAEFQGMSIFGIGGGIPVTPFGDWSYDFNESQAAVLLDSCPPTGILVSHSPPIDSVDHDSSGKIRGSRAIRAAIEERLLKLVVCGHIHSDWEKRTTIGETLIVNAGPRGVMVEI